MKRPLGEVSISKPYVGKRFGKFSTSESFGGKGTLEKIQELTLIEVVGHDLNFEF